MAFEMTKDEKVPDAIRRIAAERMDEALGALKSLDGQVRDEAVHTARKRLKEARAALRLVRGEFGRRAFRRENVALRDSARPLSEVRDAAVMIATLDELVEVFAKDVKPTAFRPLRKALVDRHRAIFERVARDGAVRRVTDGVGKAARRTKSWDIDHNGWKAFAPGLKRTYRQGLAAMRAAVDAGDDECLHEWRKRAKDLRYQLEMLRPVWQDVLEPLAKQAHELTNLLGKDHDLAVLSALSGDELRDALPKDERHALVALVERRRRDLQSKATRLGRKLYAEDVAAFAARIKCYWQAWQQDAKPPRRLASAAPQ
jgi:CHAD domain-containing protein